MKNIDYPFIAEHMSHISRIPVRYYKNKNLIDFYQPMNFPVDPADLYIEDLLSVKEDVSYYITPFSQYYGILTHDEHTLIIGPTYQIVPPRGEIREFMFMLGITERYLEQYEDLMSKITPMPLDVFLHMLTLIYYSISEKKINYSDFFIHDCSNKDLLEMDSTRYDNEIAMTREDIMSTSKHNSFFFEEQMLSFITDGNVDGLKELFSTHTVGQHGKIAGTYLRQVQNIFIASATLVSRAAIQGGLPYEEALTLSDEYIRHCEKYHSPEQIMNLQYHMVMDYADRVAALLHIQRDALTKKVILYVREHLTEELSVAKIADALFVTRSYLSSHFKSVTDITISNYITNEKVKKAQEYLRSTDKTLLEISTHLCFSSQGYFQNVFKKVTGMTPREYRENKL